MDVTNLTDEELKALVKDVEAEKQKRYQDQRLLDAAHALVAEAKKLGYPKQKVALVLGRVVNDYYDGAVPPE